MPDTREEVREIRMDAAAWEESLPAAYRMRMQELLGDEYAAFMAAGERPRRPSLRINPLKEGEDAAVTEALGTTSEDRVPWEETGRYCAADARPGRTVMHEAGAFYMQEASAMLPAAIAAPQPGEYVLDLCAAPGGKSTQAAGRLLGQGLLVANEIHPARARILSGNLERMGVRNAVVTNEDPAVLEGRFHAFFDLVMVDAPCSGEGMFRKEPQAVTDWSPETVSMCAARQERILEAAAAMTAPGGRIVYSTCTFAPEEDEEQVLAFLRRHPEFRLETPALLAEGCRGLRPGLSLGDAEDRALCGKMVRIWPHRAEGEGHFAALMVKEGKAMPHVLSGTGPASAGAGTRKDRKKRAGRGAGDKAQVQEALKLWAQFAEDQLTAACSLPAADKLTPADVVLFGEELYLLPAPLRLEGLRVLRPGLHLGTVRKGRLIPAHALAMALGPEECADVYETEAEGPAARAWLRGESLSDSDGTGGRGWTLVCAGGRSLGWGRRAGNMIKNHYPRGLRR